MTKRILFLIVLAAGLGWLPSAATAGTVYDTPSCSKNGDGSGSCSGSYYGFRASSDANAGAYFVSFYGFMMFAAQLNGAYYSCSLSYSGSAAVTGFKYAMGAHDFFSIDWDRYGTCQNVNVWTTSETSGY